jgi:hypothetical protein
LKACFRPFAGLGWLHHCRIRKRSDVEVLFCRIKLADKLSEVARTEKFLSHDNGRMVNLFRFPLQAEKLESPTTAFKNPKLVFGQSWKVVTAKKVHILLASQVRTVVDPKAEVVLFRIAPGALASRAKEGTKNRGEYVDQENGRHKRCQE